MFLLSSSPPCVSWRNLHCGGEDNLNILLVSCIWPVSVSGGVARCPAQSGLSYKAGCYTIYSAILFTQYTDNITLDTAYPLVNHGNDQPGMAPSLPPLPAPAPSDPPAGGQPLQEPQGAGVLHRGRDQGEDHCHVSRVTCNLSHVRAAWTRCWTQTISRRCFGTLEIARGVKMF